MVKGSVGCNAQVRYYENRGEERRGRIYIGRRAEVGVRAVVPVAAIIVPVCASHQYYP